MYRFWRDPDYAVGALVAGLMADALGLRWAILGAGVLTALSGLVVMQPMENFGVDRARILPAFDPRR
ncbi:hypothetical protein NET02_02025 [Thermomicrobiaceae bacterium CFH 74404]|uniref:Major facilitator superfamily (MFS) profile domain-containing protein n=1 Tax=Thermalbibacter longus TaxID=2951981 RepID=A0AA41W9B5_9BACT|nr:hypothetical protein [Thermalbibacter longus]MCM8747919.1 hypothetical protein [Thermalbibacter longus]